MAVVGNIEETTASVVLDQGLWMGTKNDSTAWLSGIAGVSAGQAEGGLKMMILDVACAAASTITTVNLATTNITGVSGTTCYAILGVHNMSGGFEMPTLVHIAAGIPTFTTAAATAGDTHRITILYA